MVLHHENRSVRSKKGHQLTWLNDWQSHLLREKRSHNLLRDIVEPALVVTRAQPSGQCGQLAAQPVVLSAQRGQLALIVGRRRLQQPPTFSTTLQTHRPRQTKLNCLHKTRLFLRSLLICLLHKQGVKISQFNNKLDIKKTSFPIAHSDIFSVSLIKTSRTFLSSAALR